MAGRGAIIVLAIAAMCLVRPARADDPACAQYQEPLAYNACLARHGPKANDLATRPAQGEYRPAPRARAGYPSGGSSGEASGRSPRAPRTHGRVHMEFQIK